LKRYRSRIQIMADILRAIQRRGRARVTHILRDANLSHDRLKRYLAELEEKGLVVRRAEGEHVVYGLTERGVRFLLEYEKVRRFAEAFGLEL